MQCGNHTHTVMDPERGIATSSHTCKQLKKVVIRVIHNSEMMTAVLFQGPRFSNVESSLCPHVKF